ncbi:MAG: hypothetical protein EOM73_14415 [Bacteroidia bacterium]|nr:hypothetical protein [Bacteroidia bacterium]
MGKIKSGQVKLKSKYIFIAEKLGLGTAFALSVLLSVLFFNLILFYLKETDNLKYLSFGKFGIFAFLESFPYLLVVAFIILIVLSGYLITKSDVSYKKPFGYLAVGLVLFIMFFGGILTYTNLGKAIEMQAQNGVAPARMLLRPMMDVRNNGVAGVVFEQGEDYLILQTPQGLRSVDLDNLEEIPEMEKGQFVLAVGKKEGFDFKAEKIRVTSKDEMPAVERGIKFKFRPENGEDFPSNVFYFEDKQMDCIKKCSDSGKELKECFEECRK